MRPLERQFLKVVLLTVTAVLLGVAVLAADSSRRSQPASAADLQLQRQADLAQADPVARAIGDRPGTLVAAAATVPAPQAPVVPRIATRGGVACAQPHQVVEVPSSLPIRATPGGRAVGELPSSSRYLGQSTTAWVQATTANGRWGKVSVPWAKPVGRTGWIPLTGLAGGSTRAMVVADLSERSLRAYRGCAELFMVRTAIGRPGSPSPQGRFWVTDPISVPSAQRGSFGSFAFGLSTVQPNLPAGWTGGDQMAIHGTGAPGSIGQAASAGCLRVDERALERLKPLLRVGTPVVIQA